MKLVSLAVLAGCGRLGFEPSFESACPTFESVMGLPATYRLGSQQASWANARLICGGQNADLAYPRDGQEALVLASIATGAGTTTIWVGVHDLEAEDAWTNIDGQPQTFLPWNDNSGEPNGDTTENCVKMTDDRFIDADCPDEHDFICACDP